MAKAAANNSDNGAKSISVVMELARETKGTYIYTSTATVRTVYINREGLPDGAPQRIKVSITEER
jgi:hypothetical protein